MLTTQKVLLPLSPKAVRVMECLLARENRRMEGVVKRTRNEDKISEIDNDRGFIHSLQRSLAEAKSFVEPSHSPYAVPEEDLSGGGGLFSGGGTDPGGEMFSRG